MRCFSACANLLACVGFVVCTWTTVVLEGSDFTTLLEIPATLGVTTGAEAFPDLDGDGLADLVVGETAAFGGLGAVVGYNVLGEVLFEWTNPTSIRFGRSLARVPDHNGDGIPDLLVASGVAGIANNVFLIDITTGETILTLDNTFCDTGLCGGVLCRLGFDMENADDVDGDGVRDFIISNLMDPDNNLMVSVHSGADGSVIHMFVPPVGPGGSGFLAWQDAIAGLGDVNGDGLADVAIGDPGAFSLDGDIVGGVGVYSGADASLIWHVFGPADATGYCFGGILKRLGDLDGDGISDLVVTDFCAGPVTGRVFIYSGATGEELEMIEGPVAGPFGRWLSVIEDMYGVGGDYLAIAGLLFGQTYKVYLYSLVTRNIEGVLDTGSFTSEGALTAGGADFDGDGVKDPVVVDRVENTGGISVYTALPTTFLRGDANADGAVDIGDAVTVLGSLFGAGGALGCRSAADGNGDGRLDIGDPIYLLVFQFAAGAPPPAPFPACGDLISPFSCPVTPCP